MKYALVAAIAGMILAATGISVAAAKGVRQVDVQFAAGATSASFKGSVKGDGGVQYRLKAKAGQTMSVSLRARNASANFNVLAPGSDTAMFIGQVSGNDFSGALPMDGTYVVDVYLVRAAARRNEGADFTINFRIDAGRGGSAAPGGSNAMPPVPQPDFADSYGGGPDFWAVTGLPAGDTLGLRSEPSAQAQVIRQLGEGAVVRNLGCRPIDGARWCRVQLTGDANATGWVNGRHLREAAAPAEPHDARVAGTPYNATGQIPCTVKSNSAVRTCDFGVVRSGKGVATVDVTFPDGFKRTLHVSHGQVTTSGGGTVTTRRDGDDTIIIVDDAETFVVPDALVDGG